MIKVITGAMFSGKSFELIGLLKQLDINTVKIFKPNIDTRDKGIIKSRNSNKVYADPQYALGEGGLVRHTQAATRIAYELFRTDLYPYNSDQQDIILASLILHDSRKHGNNGSKFTVVEHPLLAAEAIRKSKGVIKPEYRELIAKNIETHMGNFNKDYKTGREVLPRPSTGMQKFVHQCDYLRVKKMFRF